jgi:hypothetical protein
MASWYIVLSSEIVIVCQGAGTCLDYLDFV